MYYKCWTVLLKGSLQRNTIFFLYLSLDSSVCYCVWFGERPDCLTLSDDFTLFPIVQVHFALNQVMIINVLFVILNKHSSYQQSNHCATRSTQRSRRWVRLRGQRSCRLQWKEPTSWSGSTWRTAASAPPWDTWTLRSKQIVSEA